MGHIRASRVGLLGLLVALIAAAPAAANPITVTNGNDSGAGSLRDAISTATAGGTVVIPAGTTVTISSGELLVDKNLTITGGGARSTTVTAGGTSRVFHVSATVQISGLTITGGNAGAGYGGGALVDSGALTITDSTVTGNSVNSGQNGAGVANSGAALTILRSAITNNTGADNGGGIEVEVNGESPGLVLTNSTVAGNRANGVGGGLYINSANSTVALTNDTISGNSASPSGGASGGGLDISSHATSPTPTIVNTIVADNHGDSGGENCVNHSASVNSLGHNLEDRTPDQCGFTGTGDQVGANPMLGPLANNGGPTNTQMLMPGSAAIDSGDNSQCPSTDQRGAPRPQPPGGTCDVGAYEAGGIADLGMSQLVYSDVNQSQLIGQLTIGGEAVFVAKATNHGPDFASGVKVQDTLPAGGTLVNATSSTGSCSGTGPVTCDLGTLTPGASAQATLFVRLNQLGPATNTAAVTSGALDPVPANNSSVGRVQVLPPPSPVVASFGMTHRRFRVGSGATALVARRRPPRGSAFVYGLSEPAQVVITISRPVKGHRRGRKGRCQAKRRRGKRCTTYRTVGALTRSAQTGANRTVFSGRLGTRALRRGRYRATIVARVAGAPPSAAQQVSFTVVR